MFYETKEDNKAVCNKGTLLIIPFPLNSVVFHNNNIEVTNENNSMLMKITNKVLKAVKRKPLLENN